MNRRIHKGGTFVRRLLISVAAMGIMATACFPTASPAPGPKPPSGPTTTTAPPASTTTTTGAVPTTTTPAVVQPQNGPTAWSTPAAGIPTSPRSADWAARYAQYADPRDHEPSINFGLGAASGDYSVPIYDAAEATGRSRVFQRPAHNWNGRFDIATGGTIPWNPSWLPADGTDGHMVIIDSRTGEEFDVWALSTPSFSPSYLSQLECLQSVENVLAGYNTTRDLCAAAVMRIREPSGATADVRTYTGNYPATTEVGVQNSAGIATPDEVASGRIPHALRMAVSLTATMSGPRCPADVTSPDDPRVGTTCGVAVAPAGKFNAANRVSTPEALTKTIAQGTRVVVDVTDAEIEQWLTSRGYTGAQRSTARIFAVALRDYGMIQVMTSGGGWSIPVSGARNPATEAGWRNLGITGDGRDLLDGLVQPNKLRVLSPPTNTCNGVATKLACWSSSTSY